MDDHRWRGQSVDGLLLREAGEQRCSERARCGHVRPGAPGGPPASVECDVWAFSARLGLRAALLTDRLPNPSCAQMPFLPIGCCN